MRIGILAIALLFSVCAQAQLKKTLHKVFELPPEATKLVLNIYEGDEYEIVPWAGNTILTETDVAMRKASKGVFDFFVEEGRYDFDAQLRSDSLVLSSKDLLRRVIKIEDTAAEEKVRSRIFIPDVLEQQSPTLWTRPEAEEWDGTPRKRLNRERMEASDAVKEAVRPTVDSTGQPTGGLKEATDYD